MDLATILNPSSNKPLNQNHSSSLHSPPISPKRLHHGIIHTSLISNMKPRSRFSALEDAIICQGVANGLTWGQISGQLPHRKRATCFNRYRTLQGVRKSRPQVIFSPSSLYYYQHHYSSTSPPPSTNTTQWLPSPPPSSSPTLMTDSRSPSIDTRHQNQHSFGRSVSTLSIPPISRDSRRDTSSLSSNVYHYHPY